MFGKKNNNTNNGGGNNGGNNGNNGNNNNHTSGWRWLALLLLILVFLSLVVIHVANYVYLRNASNNGLGYGNTGYSATTPIFETGIAEFVSLGFLILPLILLITIFSGWWDYRTAIVANVFAFIDFIVILFTAVGIIVVHHMDRNSAYGGVSYCNYHPQHTVTHLNVTAINTTVPIYNTTTGEQIGVNSTIQYIDSTYNTTSDDNSGSEYHFEHKYCKAQSTLLAGIVALLFFMLLTWLLSHMALRGARRHANTTVYNTTQTTYAVQPVAVNTTAYPAGTTVYPAGTTAYPAGTTAAYPVSNTGSLNNV